MKNPSLMTLRPSHGKSAARKTIRLNVVLVFAMFNIACGASDPVSSPSLSSANPAEEPQTPFSPISSGDNPISTPISMPDQAQGGDSDSAPMGTTLPVMITVEPEPASVETPAVTTVSSASCIASDSDMQQRMLQLINEARATERSCGDDRFAATRALSWNASLANAARVHSDDMATHNFFSHTGSDGSTASTRVSEAGYLWRTVGENIAAGRELAADTLNDWLESPGHCRNIMNPSFTEVAVVCAESNDTDYRRYWTNVLAAPR